MSPSEFDLLVTWKLRFWESATAWNGNVICPQENLSPVQFHTQMASGSFWVTPGSLPASSSVLFKESTSLVDTPRNVSTFHPEHAQISTRKKICVEHKRERQPFLFLFWASGQRVATHSFVDGNELLVIPCIHQLCATFNIIQPKTRLFLTALHFPASTFNMRRIPINYLGSKVCLQQKYFTSFLCGSPSWCCALCWNSCMKLKTGLLREAKQGSLFNLRLLWRHRSARTTHSAFTEHFQVLQNEPH